MDSSRPEKSASDADRAPDGEAVCARSRRRRLRVGFALCGAALALALLYLIASGIAATAGSPAPDSADSTFRPVFLATEILYDSLMLVGLVLLYLTPIGRRWRMASTTLLVMIGIDVAILVYHVLGTDDVLMALVDQFGLAVAWVELWMIAVLGAETAEDLERPEITYQTEVAGRLVISGAVAWVAYLIWSFDPRRPVEPGDDFLTVVLSSGFVLLLLFALTRVVMICGGLTAALSPAARVE